MASQYEMVKADFYIHYKDYVDKFETYGIDLSIRLLEKRKKKFVKVTLVPRKRGKLFFGKSFYAKPLTSRNNYKISSKDSMLERFLKKQLLLLQKAPPEKVCAENLSNFLIRWILIWRAESIPKTYRKYDVRIFYAIFYLLLLAVLSILIAHSEVQAAKNFGWIW